MDKYSLRIKVKDGEVEEILSELEKAQKMIEGCFYKLRAIGLLTIEKEEAASGN